jgi:hypothetical protein
MMSAVCAQGNKAKDNAEAKAKVTANSQMAHDIGSRWTIWQTKTPANC